MLAAGWRKIHHVSAGVHAQPGDREAERRDVPDADLRRAHYRDALADAEAWRGALSAGAGEESRGANSSQCRNWRGPGDDAGRNFANTAGLGRDDVQRIFAPR